MSKRINVVFNQSSFGKVPVPYSAHRNYTKLEHKAKADLQRTQLFDGVEDSFEPDDLLAMPTIATQGLDLHSDRGLDFEQYLTFPFNLTGHPASSVLAGCTAEDGLPVGLQIVGPDTTTMLSSWRVLQLSASARVTTCIPHSDRVR